MRISDWSSDVCSSDLYLGAGGGGDKGFGVGIALVDLKIEDRRKAEPRHIGDQQPRRGLADRREGEGGRNRHHQDEDDEIERGCHLMLAEEERRPGEIGDQLNEEEQQRETAPLRAACMEDHRERSEESRVGEEGVRTRRYRWSAELYKKTTKI